MKCNHCNVLVSVVCYALVQLNITSASAFYEIKLLQLLHDADVCNNWFAPARKLA